ncbi:MAG: M20/M25/M40 family metallo-hydrolase [Bdellovibrionales bacterium]
MKYLILSLLFSISVGAAPQAHDTQKTQTIMTNMDIITALKLNPTVIDKEIGVGIVNVSNEQIEEIHELSHAAKRCAGYQTLEDGIAINQHDSILSDLKNIVNRHKKAENLSILGKPLTYNSRIDEAVSMIDAENIRSWVEWLSSYNDRYHAGKTPNAHVEEMETRLKAMIAASSIEARVERITHKRTQQNSLKVIIPGTERPEEIVVLGGHFDSINRFYILPSPGADDNASGTSSLVEALRVLLTQGQQPKRTIEFMWYAAEEVGLWGSSDIANSYKQTNKDVIAVLQLDMTLYPGDGERKFGNTSDFTSPWLRQIISDLNSLYVNGVELESACGYGCSDHASWYRQGYPAAFPMESTFNGSNKKIHTTDDIISSSSSFDHAAMFGELAVAFAIELGDNDLRQPY